MNKDVDVGSQLYKKATRQQFYGMLTGSVIIDSAQTRDISQKDIHFGIPYNQIKGADQDNAFIFDYINLHTRNQSIHQTSPWQHRAVRVCFP